MNESLLTGSCMCGDVRYELSSAATSACHCHCRACQQNSGAPYVTWATFPVECLHLSHGALAEYKSSEGVTRGHCARCGTTITYMNAKWPGDVDITAASLDDPSAILPTEHIWMDDAPPWTTVGDGLPVHARWR